MDSGLKLSSSSALVFIRAGSTRTTAAPHPTVSSDHNQGDQIDTTAETSVGLSLGRLLEQEGTSLSPVLLSSASVG